MKKKVLKERMMFAASHGLPQVYEFLGSAEQGLTLAQAAASRELYGSNQVTRGGSSSLAFRLRSAFINPFTVILIVLALVSLCTDVVFAEPAERNAATAVIITVMVLISGLLRFISEARSGSAAEALSAMIRTTACVERPGQGSLEIPLEEIAVGDVVHLAAGDMVPADVRICRAKDLFMNQSSLTGESEPVEKTAVLPGIQPSDQISCGTEHPCLAFMGSSVVSGSADAIVLAVGNDTLFGSLAEELNEPAAETGFEKGVNSVSWVLIRFMLCMVPIVFFLNGITKGDWLDAGLFAVSIAVGLTPEMLPMIVTSCLAGSAVAMSRKKVIIKKLNSIQDLGAADILCTDKTGTLTRDKVALEYHLDIHGNEDLRVLRHAFLNSFYQTGLKNHIDLAVIERMEEEERKAAATELNADAGFNANAGSHAVAGLNTAAGPNSAANALGRGAAESYRKVDEIPFDFERRRMSVVVEDCAGKTQMITKGAVEEMLSICSFVEYEGRVCPLTEEKRALVLRSADRLNAEGMRVIAVAQKTNPAPAGAFSVRDESDMVLIGCLAFLDPPKETAAAAISALEAHGVNVKILTGDNEKVSASICRQVGLSGDSILLGPQLDSMTDCELAALAETTAVFAKLSPSQKARVVRLLRDSGHTVAFMGDGINDAAAMNAADVGISVDTAVDIAKEAADVILLEKDLMVLEQGILEGRKTYANMIKYIKMTASSNFGNMFSVLAACAFLPFLPMAAIHLILLNLIYDISCTAVPFDNVDKEFLKLPRKWDASSISRFMLWIGPTSSVFDIATYLLMYFVICPSVCGGQLFHQISDLQLQALYIAVFQAGWFVESMWSQTLVIHMLRTPKLPFLQSRASAPLTLLTGAGIAAATAIPFTGFGRQLGLAPLPPIFFLWLAAILIGYMALATAVKNRYTARFGELL